MYIILHQKSNICKRFSKAAPADFMWQDGPSTLLYIFCGLSFCAELRDLLFWLQVLEYFEHSVEQRLCTKVPKDGSMDAWGWPKDWWFPIVFSWWSHCVWSILVELCRIESRCAQLSLKKHKNTQTGSDLTKYAAIATALPARQAKCFVNWTFEFIDIL